MMDRGRLSTMIALTGLALLVTVALVASGDSQATVTGKPVPPAGSDWVIDVDTTVDDEALVQLNGHVVIMPGYTLDVSDSTLQIASSTPGEHGILVDANTTSSGTMSLSSSTVSALSTDSGFYFVVLGDLSMSSSTLSGVDDGLIIMGGDATIRGCAITAHGDSGVTIEDSSPIITGTTIDLATDDFGIGLDVLGTSTGLTKPVLEDLSISVKADLTTSSASMTTNVDLDLLGLRAFNADLGTLKGIDISHGASVDATTTNAGNPRMYIRLYSTGLSLGGGTSVAAFDNVTVRGTGFDAVANYGGTRTFRLYTYDYVTGVENAIDSTGSSPSDIGGIIVSDQVVTFTLAGTGTHYDYDYGRGILWQPDPAAVQGDGLAFGGIALSNVTAEEGLEVDDEWNLTLDTCLVYECAFTSGFLVVDGWAHDVVVSGCWFSNSSVNGLEGDMVHALKMSGDLEVTRNTVEGNSLGTFLTVDAPLGGVVVTNNALRGNYHNYDLVYLTAPGILAENTLDISLNAFTDNECQKIDHAMIMVEHPKQNVTVRENTFTNNTGDGIYFLSPYSNYATFANPSFTFSVLDNTFLNMTGNSIVFMNLDNNNVVVRDNEATGCSYPVLKMDQDVVSFSDSNHWGSMVTYLQGPDSITVRDNDLSGNPGGGMDLRVSKYDSKYSEFSGNPYAEVVIRDNDLSNSGSSGWALSIVGLYNRPDIAGNDMDGSVEAMHMGMIDDEAKRNPFVMLFEGQVIDGRNEGVTGFSFEDLSASFYNCTFLNYTHSIRTNNADVTVLWSRLPTGSAYVLSGSVTVYNHLEISVHWSDHDDVDSGMPIAGASVSLMTQGGQSIEALVTDDAGMTPVTVVKVWEMLHLSYSSNSPLRVSISAKGEYVEHYLSVDREMVGASAAMLRLPDVHVPILSVSSPWSGSVLSTQDITLKGVLTETGSAIEFFGARHDGMPVDDWVSITPSTLWTYTFQGLSQGPHNFTVKATDHAGNTASVQLAITIDLDAPSLDWHPAYLDGTPLPFDTVSMSYYVTTPTIVIDGTYGDDMTDLEDIVIRLDGTILTALGGQLGRINVRVDLHEGINMLMLDATDLAGNRAVQQNMVTLDSAPPVLYVTNPLSGLMTQEPMVTVQGLTEPATKLKFQVESSSGTRVYDHVETSGGDKPILSEEDGTFAFEIELFEGIQVLIVSVEDTAGNVRDTEINVVLDTQGPEFVLNSPEEDVTVTQASSWEVVGTVTGDFSVTLIVNGQRSQGAGIFSVQVPLHEGENTLEVTALDDVGNAHTEVRTIIVDTLPPVLVLTSPQVDDLLTRDTTVTIGGTVTGATVTDGTAGVYLTIGGAEHDATLVSGTWDDGVWEYSLELGATDLDQEITVTASDAAGNTDTTSFRVRLDVIPPSLQVDTVPQSTKAPVLDITGNTDESVETVWVNGIPYDTIEGSFSASYNLVAGENTLEVVAMDEAGNTQSEVLTVNLEWEQPGAEPESTSEGTDSGTAYAIALVVAGLAVLALAVILAGDRERRDA
jgi:hypothetical protein